ncbi:MAG TPA: hypothetical protein VMG13_03195, partial [Trebonia sp.]|nr:hypothetical protein [Trebonia sp.]
MLFVALSADDVVYQDAGAFVAGPSALVPAPATGNPPIPPGTSLYVRGYSGGAQTRWLEDTLAAARRDASVDWIVAQLHQCACSSSHTGNGSDLGIREEWLPLFDQYEVDLVLCGHDHDYERSFPVRGADALAGTSVASGGPVDTRRPHPVTRVDSGVFDTSQGSVHLILGCGGTDDNLDSYGLDAADGLAQAKVFTRPDRPVPSSVSGVYTRPGADAVEDATWSARRDTATGYGIAVFDVNPGTEAGGQTSITVTHYHAVGADPVNPASGEPGAPTDDYTAFETFTLVRPRSDGRRWHAKQSASAISGLAGAPANARRRRRAAPDRCRCRPLRLPAGVRAATRRASCCYRERASAGGRWWVSKHTRVCTMTHYVGGLAASCCYQTVRM